MKFTNRIIAAFLCIVMMSAFACLSVSAITLFPVGDWVYQKINNNTEFEIYEYKGSQATVFTPYTHNLTPITTVGANAFDSNESLSKITLSKNITTISHHAFLNCKTLSTVAFQSESVTYIGDYAFAGCSALNTISLEDTLIENIPTGAFMNCDSLVEIVVPDTVTSISADAFAYCDNLQKIVIPATVTDIDYKAFEGSEVVIYCYKDSLAHRYAENNYRPYVLIDADPVITYILGDADNSGEVSIIDATEVQLLIAQLVQPQDDYTQIRADIDSDGVLSIMDATSIQMFIAGIEVEYPIGETFEV